MTGRSSAGAGVTLVSVDLDDAWTYHQHRRDASDTADRQSYLEEAAARACRIFDETGIRATFFIVARDLEIRRDTTARLCARLREAGHEVANHGFAHEPCGTLSDQEVADDIGRSTELLRAHGAGPVTGYRGPAWSVDDRVLAALESLDYRYDASLFPSPLAPLMRTYFRLRTGRSPKSIFGRLPQNLGWRPTTRLALLPVAVSLGVPFYSTLHLYGRIGAMLFRVQAPFALRTAVCSYVFHAIDFVDGAAALPPGDFHARSMREKELRIRSVIERISRGRRCVPHADQVEPSTAETRA